MAGVGSEIKRTLAIFHIYANEGCSCTALSDEMDKMGIDYVEKYLDNYVIKMRESIKKWRKENGSYLPTPPDSIIKKLIEYAISKARSG